MTTRDKLRASSPPGHAQPPAAPEDDTVEFRSEAELDGAGADGWFAADDATVRAAAPVPAASDLDALLEVPDLPADELLGIAETTGPVPVSRPPAVAAEPMLDLDALAETAADLAPVSPAGAPPQAEVPAFADAPAGDAAAEAPPSFASAQRWGEVVTETIRSPFADEPPPFGEFPAEPARARDEAAPDFAHTGSEPALPPFLATAAERFDEAPAEPARAPDEAAPDFADPGSEPALAPFLAAPERFEGAPAEPPHARDEAAPDFADTGSEPALSPFRAAPRRFDEAPAEAAPARAAVQDFADPISEPSLPSFLGAPQRFDEAPAEASPARAAAQDFADPNSEPVPAPLVPAPEAAPVHAQRPAWTQFEETPAPSAFLSPLPGDRSFGEGSAPAFADAAEAAEPAVTAPTLPAVAAFAAFAPPVATAPAERPVSPATTAPAESGSAAADLGPAEPPHTAVARLAELPVPGADAEPQRPPPLPAAGPELFVPDECLAELLAPAKVRSVLPAGVSPVVPAAAAAAPDAAQAPAAAAPAPDQASRAEPPAEAPTEPSLRPATTTAVTRPELTPAGGTSRRAASRRQPLGQLLVAAGAIKADQLEMALAEQRRTRNLLGDTLVSLGFATEAAVAEMVSRQTGIPLVRVPPEPIANNFRKLITEDVARTHRLLPLALEGSVLKLAMANPFDVVALDTIRESTGLVPVPHIAPWGQILAAIERSFSARETFNETFEALIAQAEAKIGSDDQENATRGPLVELVDQLILHAVEERATDIHIEPEEFVVRVRYRVDSVLQPGPMIPKKLQSAIAARLKVMGGLNISENRLPQDGRIRFEVKGRQVDLRMSTFLCNFGENIVLRVLDKASVVLSLEKLGLLEDDRATFERMIEKPHGIILVTGPTGSGKTTTLYAALSKLNTIDVNIMTIEDPIEYELTLIRQSQVNTKAGITFASGLRALLRQDPDIILIGEMRDEETAQMAVRAAMTGHLVFSTLHTNTAIGAVPRLSDMKIEPLLIGETIIAVLAQRLARKVCPECRVFEPCPPERRADFDAAARKEGIDWDGMVAVAKGCHACRFRGYQGRLALFEIFEMNAKAQEMILRRQFGQGLYESALQHGMRPLYDDGLRKVLLKYMTIDELDRVIDRELREKID